MDGAKYYIHGDNYGTYNKIEVLYLPDSITGIHNYAFRNIRITKLYLNKKEPVSLGLAYGSNLSNCDMIYVPVECSEAYKNATNWNSYTNYVEYDFDTDPDNIRPQL